ncbi:MAG: (2Fe-2S)-binding protein [Cellulosilyticaceae bacterium]
MSSLEEQIKDKLTKICICRAINRDTIKNSIRNGAKTVDEVKANTGATNGACHGGRCQSKIQELIAGYENQEWQ